MKRWRTLMLTLLLTLTLGFLVLTWPAVAQDRPCAADVQKLCKDLGPDNQGGMIQCLKDHDTDLSDACKARMQTFAHEPCAQDALTFCTDVEPGNRRKMVHCLRDHETALSDTCKARLHEFWSRLL